MSKVGRNDPCPCGSGKKYKQCCWKKRLPLGKRKFKASVISAGTGPVNKLPDLMERTFGDAVRSEEASNLKDALSRIAPKQEDLPKIDAQKSLKDYLKASEEAKKNQKSDDSA